jgi:hypothetical protein
VLYSLCVRTYCSLMAVILCPFCERNDLLQKIGPIIDSGTTDSDALITGIATGWNVGFASLSGVNVSRLATRLSGPGKPTLNFLQNYLISYALSFIILLNVINRFSDWKGNYFLGYSKESLIFSSLFSILWAFALKLPVQTLFNLTFLRARRLAWQRNRQVLRSEYYCLRDDVIVHEGEAYDVETYLQWRFSLS